MFFLNSPYNEARYRALLRGLDINVLSKNKLILENDSFRLDSEYFLPKHFDVKKNTQIKYSLITLREIGSVLKGFTVPYDENGSIPIIRSGDLVDIDNDDNTLKADKSQSIFYLNRGDVLISSIGAGSIGKVQVFDKEGRYGTVSEVTVIRQDKMSPYFIAAFLQSWAGQMQIERFITGATGQQHLYPRDVEHIWIPVCSVILQKAIEKCFLTARKLSEKSSIRTYEAKQALLKELKLEDWQPSISLAYTHGAFDAFSSDRLDAEHFEPKHIKIENHIKATNRFAHFETLLSMNQRGRQPDYSDAGVLVINSKHVINNEVKIDVDNRLANISSGTEVIRYGDVLMNGTGIGTIGRAAPYLHSKNAIPDNHVTILRINDKRLDPVYLSVFLNSIAGQYQVEKWYRGSSGQIELYPNDIAKFIIWLAPDNVQALIRGYMVDSYNEKSTAKALLKAAKRAVEIAIEQNEDIAIQYLRELEIANAVH